MTVTSLRQLQVGKETTWGTAVPQTVQLAKVTNVTIPPSLVSEIVPHFRGSMGPGNNIMDLRHEVSGVTIEGMFPYEEMPYWMDMLHEGVDAGAGPYTYTYTAPEDAAVTYRYQTVAFGAADIIVNVTSAVAKSITLDWEWGQALKWTVELMGAKVQTDTFDSVSETATASLVDCLAAHAKLYVDAWGGTMGSTEFTKMISGSLTIDTNRQYLRYCGSLTPTGVYDAPGWRISGKVVCESDATSAAWATSSLSAAQQRLIRVDFDNGGATTSNRGLTLDTCARVWVSNLFTDADGLQTVELEFESAQEADNDYFTAVVTNNTNGIY